MSIWKDWSIALSKAFDVDGVLANFVQGHLDLIKEVTGIKLPEQSDSFPDKWDYHLPYISNEDDKRVWDIIARSDEFWEALEPQDESLLELLSTYSRDHGDLYFVTNRFGNEVKRQTELWLEFYGINYPSVIVAKDKAPILKALKVTLFVDDKPENCIEASTINPGTLKILMPDRPYNRWITPEGVIRSTDLVGDVASLLGL